MVATVRETAVAEWARLAKALDDPELGRRLDDAGAAVIEALGRGHKLLLAGNGGSAAMANHVAAEFSGKCVQDRAPLPAISLAESVTGVTAIGNDYGFDEVFARGVRAHGRPGDVLLAMSTSGESPNVRRALAVARELGLVTILLTGERGAHLTDVAHHLLAAPASSTPRVQEVHLLWTHAWCEVVDALWAER